MKKITFLIFLSSVLLQAQTIYFEQDFEGTEAITNIRNGDAATAAFIETSLPVGPPACGYMSKGDAATLNSTNVDYKADQNDGSFLNLNPEVACSGYYSAAVRTEILDLSSATSGAFISGRYYATSTLNYGMLNFGIAFYNGTTQLIFDMSNFTVRDNWTEFELQIPESFVTETFVMGIGVQAGEAVGFDDLVISDYSVLGLEKKLINELKIYPNPVVDGEVHFENFSKLDIEIFNILGKKIKELKNVDTKFEVNDLNSGIYILKFNDGVNSVIKKIIKVD